MTALFDFYGTVNNVTNTQEQCDRSIGLAVSSQSPSCSDTSEPLPYCPCLYSTIESFTIFPAQKRGPVHLQSAIKINSTPSQSPSLQTILTPNRTHKMQSYELVASYISS